MKCVVRTTFNISIYFTSIFLKHICFLLGGDEKVMRKWCHFQVKSVLWSAMDFSSFTRLRKLNGLCVTPACRTSLPPCVEKVWQWSARQQGKQVHSLLLLYRTTIIAMLCSRNLTCPGSWHRGPRQGVPTFYPQRLVDRCLCRLVDILRLVDQQYADRHGPSVCHRSQQPAASSNMTT